MHMQHRPAVSSEGEDKAAAATVPSTEHSATGNYTRLERQRRARSLDLSNAALPLAEPPDRPTGLNIIFGMPPEPTRPLPKVNEGGWGRIQYRTRLMQELSRLQEELGLIARSENERVSSMSLSKPRSPLTPQTDHIARFSHSHHHRFNSEGFGSYDGNETLVDDEFAVYDDRLAHPNQPQTSSPVHPNLSFDGDEDHEDDTDHSLMLSPQDLRRLRSTRDQSSQDAPRSIPVGPRLALNRLGFAFMELLRSLYYDSTTRLIILAAVVLFASLAYMGVSRQ